MISHIPKISCSLLAAVGKGAPLTSVVGSFEDLGVDMIHFDVAEIEPSLSLLDIPELRKHTGLPFDVHLTVDDPEQYVDQLSLHPNDLLAFHVENNVQVKRASEIKQALGCRFGLAIRKETSIEALAPFASLLDFVLFMAAEPGVSGGSFDFSVVEKIEKFRRRFPGISAHVDGGVNRETSAVLRDVRVDTLISGSYLLKEGDSECRVSSLLGRNLLFPVSFLMRSGRELPLVQSDATIQQAAIEIESKGIGCACVVNRDGSLLGLVTDGDIRRKLIECSDFGGVLAQDVMSFHPLTVDPDQRVLDALRHFEAIGKRPVVVPVCDYDNKCIGILNVQDILQTEAV